MTTKRLGEILVDNHFCTDEDIQKALDIQKSYGGKIGTIILNMGNITEEQLLISLSQQLDIPFLKTIDNIEPLSTGLKWKILSDSKCIPFDETDTTIQVVINDPLQINIISIIAVTTGKNVQLHLTKEDNISKLIGSIDLDEFESELHSLETTNDEIDKLKEMASEAPVIKLVNSLFIKAQEMQASDIHFESTKDHMNVRLRIDGILHHISTIGTGQKLAVISRLKLISDMNIAENRLPQDGRISLKIASKMLDIRSSSVPTQHGESFVLRFLGNEDIAYSLDSLGFFPDHIMLINKFIEKPDGIFLTTGPTGSGKTTSLYAMLSKLNSEAVKIVTVEDPVEYEFDGINQIQVKSEIDYTFANALRSILRQDPDIIMIGEIRDKETAEIAIQSSLTGHLVLSTLHTNSALGSISRLLDMGIDFFLLKSSLSGVMAQRLVRRLCPHCAEAVDTDEALNKMYNIDALLLQNPSINYSPKQPKGCESCNHTGYKGRLVIAEVIPFDQKLHDFFHGDASFSDLSALGYRSMMEDGILKFCQGTTSIDEILRVTQ